MQWWKFGLHKKRGISRLAEDLLASQEGLCCMELVKYSISRSIGVLCRLEDYSGLVSSDRTGGSHITVVTQENGRVQLTAIWSDTAMNWGARLYRNTAPLFAGTNTRINAPQCEELACSWPHTQKWDPRWKNSQCLLTAISLEHAFNTTIVALCIVKSVHEIAGCFQSYVRFLLCQR